MGRAEMGVADFEALYEEDAPATEVHPIIQLLVKHYRDFRKWKDARADLSPAAFNREFGLLIQGPAEWPYVDAVHQVCKQAITEGASSVDIIYGSTAQYDKISKTLYDSQNILFYMSWQEIYTAVQLVGNDARLLQTIRDKLSKADLVFFMGAPLAVTEIIEQVRAFCDGCLITFS
jgi:hypothetical protein